MKDIRQQYKDKTGQDCYTERSFNDNGSFTDSYVEWLEDKLNKNDIIKSAEIKEICLEIQGAWCEKYNGCKECPLHFL